MLASFLAPAGARTSSELPIGTVDIDSGDARPLIHGGAYPRYAAGYVLFLRNGALVAARIDVSARTASDRAIVVVPDVFQNPAMVSGNYAVSPAGTIAYAPGTAADFNRGLLLIDAKGTRTELTDERRFFDRVRGALTELTTGDQNGVSPVWTPDGTRIVFTTYPTDGPRNLHWMAADGSGGPERLSTSEFVQRPNAWTPDGQTLVFDLRTAASLDLWTLTLDANRTTRPLLATRFNESSAALSPNGDWMAFQTDQSGRTEISLTRFLAAPKPSGEGGPSVEGRIQVSTDGGRTPAWSRDGRRLYYRSEAGGIMAVDVSAGSPPSLSRPTEVARLPRAPAMRGNFDVMPDGRLVVVDDESAGGVAQELRIVVNWFAELRQKMSGGR